MGKARRLTKAEHDELEALTYHELTGKFIAQLEIMTLRSRYEECTYEEQLFLHYTEGANHPDDWPVSLERWDAFE